MKRQPMILIAAAISLLMCSSWISAVLADVRYPAFTPAASRPAPAYPLHKDCVVTVDTRSAPKPAIAGNANISTGFSAPDTVRGTLVRLDADWLVLRDGCYENWIPKDKILMINVCD